MEGVIFGLFSLSIILLFGAIQCLSVMRASTNEYMKQQQRKRLITLNSSALILFLTGILLFVYFY